ncbi:unnamed protein product [Dovyalis caffra]|uniref:Uncharacterized protein n=1 Tax=Dovyalis caffra TaxID=77055 RepID=A0AAV1SQ76_9ROSI|nr:unnamed protein product [Dovyalis caffra]
MKWNQTPLTVIEGLAFTDKQGVDRGKSGFGRNLEKTVDRRFGRKVRNEEMENNADKLVEIVSPALT